MHSFGTSPATRKALTVFKAVGKPMRQCAKYSLSLHPSAEEHLGTFAVGTDPWAVAFDGADIWVTNIGSNTLSTF
jgi:hypothetical protein